VAVFALLFLSPLLLYCGIQTVGDAMRRSWAMTRFGALVIAIRIDLHYRAFTASPNV